jgi:hypothetical protein
MSGLLYLASIFAELARPPLRDHLFLAEGGIRRKLTRVQQACAAQAAIMEEVRTRFGAERLSIANETELQCWERMDAAGRFKLYFKKDAQPAGWSVPPSWGDRQRHWDARVFMPPEGSADQAWLKDAARRIDAAAEAASPARDDKQRHARKAYYGWFDWSGEVVAAAKLRRDAISFAHAEAIAPGVFILSLSNRDNRIDVPPAMQGCPRLSKADAALLRAEPQRAERLFAGHNMRTAPERLLRILKPF